MTNFATGSINDELLFRIDNSIESRLFHKIVILVSLGMLEASIGVYTGSAVASSLTASKWSVVPERLRTLDHGRPWRDDQFAACRVSSSRDMSR